MSSPPTAVLTSPLRWLWRRYYLHSKPRKARRAPPRLRPSLNHGSSADVGISNRILDAPRWEKWSLTSSLVSTNAWIDPHNGKRHQTGVYQSTHDVHESIKGNMASHGFDGCVGSYEKRPTELLWCLFRRIYSLGGNSTATAFASIILATRAWPSR